MPKTMNLAVVLRALESLVPLHLAEAWDRVGLHVGSPEADVTAALLCIDLTEAVVREAVQSKCGLIVAYHPPIFHPLKRLTDDGPWTQRRIIAAVRAGLAVYSPHTALDAAAGGLCDAICAGLADCDGVPIQPAALHRDEYKVVVFVPEPHEAAVRGAMASAGAGGVGNYRECAFSSAGTGGFEPVRGANPTVGKVGQREEVAERRLEMLVPGSALAGVLSALRSAHPYEEPAVDVFKLHPEPPLDHAAQGPGRLMELPEPVAAEHIIEKARSMFGVPLRVGGVQRSGGERGAVRTVAVCPGAGGSLFEQVDADCYVTGEMQHHQALDLVQRGKLVILAGHTHTERPFLTGYRDRIMQTDAGGIAWHVSASDRCPWEPVGAP